jgi:hypothetical protein
MTHLFAFMFLPLVILFVFMFPPFLSCMIFSYLFQCKDVPFFLTFFLLVDHSPIVLIVFMFLVCDVGVWNSLGIMGVLVFFS